ncbi:unnamed protein product [Alopecurus aequalis]
MEYSRSASAFARPALARTALPRVAPSTIASIAMEDLRRKNMACSGIPASRIIAQWAVWRRQACEQMLLSTAHDLDRDSEILAVASLQVVSTMLDTSFLRARAGAKDDAGSERRAVVRRIARERKAPVPALHSSPRSVGVEREKHGRVASLQGHVEQRDMRDSPRLCGWEGRRRHVVTRELQGLSEHRAVSAFAHRNCFESFFRRRIFFCGVHDEGSASMATRESGEPNQSPPLTDDQETSSSMSLETADSEHHSFTDQILRDDNHHLENATGNHEIHTFQPTEDQSVNVPNHDDALRDDIDQEQMNRYDDEYSDSSSSSPSENSVSQEAGTYGQRIEGEGGAFVDGDDEQHAVDYWFGHPVDAAYGVELPELLLTRRTFSNLLSRGFRESVDELGERPMPNTPVSVNEDHVDHGINEPNQSFLFTGEGRQRRQWHWTRPELVMDAIQEVQEEMNSMQQMLRACMQMQIELQRSIKQEVSAALNRSIGDQGWADGQQDDASRWHLVRKGTCCVCCDNQIDSLLYRCGHMCTCSKCASELLNREGKCPICRAPIVEVVRAYTAQ